MKPKIVCLCGSSRFVDIMAVVAWLLEKDEGKIAMGLHLLPRWYPNVPEHHLAEAEGVAEQMDELHLRKIDIADEIFVINWDGYIGESTAKEILYADTIDKPIRYLLLEPAYLSFVRDASSQIHRRVNKQQEPTFAYPVQVWFSVPVQSFVILASMISAPTQTAQDSVLSSVPH